MPYIDMIQHLQALHLSEMMQNNYRNGLTQEIFYTYGLKEICLYLILTNFRNFELMPLADEENGISVDEDILVHL